MHSTKESQVFLGFDFGLKYIGVAVGQKITQTASPVKTLLARDGIPNWDEIQQLLDNWRPAALIVGIPLNMDGTEQLLTHCARQFVKRLKKKYALPVYEVDERLSTWEAKQRLYVGAKGRKAKKTLHEIDAIAATLLLEQWLNTAL
jgi:putative Holliday junction resolvase